MIKNVYLDTSVIGGCYDKEFEEYSNKLIKEIIDGEKIAVISDLTRQEILPAPEKVRSKLQEIDDSKNVINVFLDSESEKLAYSYISNKVLGKIHIVDAQHIAIATINKVDVLASWNFKQIVQLDKIKMFNGVNLKEGYSLIEIRNPREVVKSWKKNLIVSNIWESNAIN